jgi:bis(5'-nucleosyl)-tetraphosphatase (symmetrical)
MSLYLIGDVQGCHEALERLLDTVGFSPSRDTIYLLGDLVNRGPDSAGVLRRLMGFGHSAQCLLGNHDLHLLAAAHGIRPLQPLDTIQDILQAPDREALLHWLRQQRLLMHEQLLGHEFLLCHAGVLPSWSAQQALALAGEVEAELQSNDFLTLIQGMYGGQPNAWSDRLQGMDRMRVIVNALTRMRFCTPEGAMEFTGKKGADQAPPGHLPWFDAPNRRTAHLTVAFGHWSTLGWLGRSDVYALDTGCAWGGTLSALKLARDGRHEWIQVTCDIDLSQQA